MKSRPRILGAVLACIGLPVVLTVTEAMSFHLRNRSNGTIVSSGQKREYVLHVPRSYDNSTPTALVISLHGAALWGAAQQEISQWNEVAEREGLIVVYPSALGEHGPRAWHVDEGSGLMKDVTFIAELIDTLQAAYNIDPARIYANGLSNGGGMAFVLSCALSNRIAAIGMVAAAQTLPWEWCSDDRAVPMISFHGTADLQVPYNGGQGSLVILRLGPAFPAVPTWTANWAERNQCESNPVETAVAIDVARIEYRDCDGSTGVVLYTIHGGGHTWPGGGPLPQWFTGATSRSIDATGLMWAFFRKYALVQD